MRSGGAVAPGNLANRRWAALAALALAAAPPAAAQRPSSVITGRVGDALSGAPLAGVTVSVEGTTLTTLTDETGNVPDRWRAGGPAGDPGAPPQLHSLCQGKCTLRWQRTGHKFRARGVP